MSEDRKIYGEGPIPQDSHAAWWAQAQQAQDAETERLRALIEQQRQEILRTIQNRRDHRGKRVKCLTGSI